jgi:hypothetical protein
MSNVRRHGMHVLLRVGEKASGEAAFEAVHVLPLEGRQYLLEFSPGLAYGIAAGDEFELSDDGTYRILKRGGNIAARAFFDQSIQQRSQELTSLVLALGGRLDGSTNQGLAYTIPLEAGFKAIESVFTQFVAANAGTIWEFGNVYADDGKPLNWWQSDA